MERVLVTGAQGFTGRHFCAAARKSGYEVYPLESDITDKAALLHEVQSVRPNYVVHLAAISAVTHEDEEALYRVNLFGTLNLLKALCALPDRPVRVLLASSANVYGNSSASPIDEQCCPAPVNHYAMSKLAMEHMASTFADRLPLCIVRPFNYTGSGHDERFVIPKLIRHFAQRASCVELGNLDVEREFNDVRAVCDVYLRLLKSAAPGDVFNVCSGRPVSLRGVIELLEQISGHQLEVRVNPAYIRPNEISRLCGSAEKLVDCIGPVPHPPLADTLHWMLSEAL